MGLLTNMVMSEGWGRCIQDLPTHSSNGADASTIPLGSRRVLRKLAIDVCRLTPIPLDSKTSVNVVQE